MNIGHRISTTRRKTIKLAHGVTAKVYAFMPSEAVQVLNSYIASDPVLQGYFGGKVNIFPIVAEPYGEVMTPYIRYTHMPVTYNPWYIRSDIVRYYVGDKSVKRIGQILDRLYELLVVDDSTIGPLPIESSPFSIRSIEFLGGTNPTGPDQENGVIERGHDFLIIYVKH